MNRYRELTFTPAVREEQAHRGVRSVLSSSAAMPSLSSRETKFIAERDTFFLASVSETGWPYVQHRGGRTGFVRHLSEATFGWAEFVGNRQYITTGNTAGTDRVAMIFVDFVRARRFKLLGHISFFELEERPDLALLLADEDEGPIERLATVEVVGFDWNCPQHIVRRFTSAECALAAQASQVQPTYRR